MKHDEKSILKFIRDNRRVMSVKELAVRLGVKERKVVRLMKSLDAAHEKKQSDRIVLSKTPLGGRFFSFFLILGLLIAGFLLYGHTLHAAFFLDDFSSIVENYRIRSFERVAWYWEHHPAVLIAYASYALNYKFGGLNSFSFHLTNTLIHVSNAVLVYLFVLSLHPASLGRGAATCSSVSSGKNLKLVAAISACVFLCHPLQTAAVTYLVQRNASLATFFYLGSLTSYAYYRRGGAWVLYLLSWLSCLAGMFTKQIAFTAPLSLLLYEVCFVSGKISKKGGREIFIRLFPFFAIWPLVYFKIFHSAVATAGLGTAAQETSALSRQEYFLTQWLVVCRYLRLLVLPVGLNFDYDFPIQHALSGETLAAGAFLMLLFFLGVFFYRRGARLPAFGVFWFFLTLSVESSFIPIRDVIFEHRVYLPMLGFAVTISWFLWRIFSSRPRLFIGLSATLIFVFGTGTYLRNRVWASELALWQDTVRKSPNKARPVNNLGVTYLERGELDKAYDCYRKAIALNPNYMDAYINLGDLYEKRKDYAKAIDSYLKALTFGPKTSAPYENLGRAYGQLGRYEDALKYLGQAIEKNPYSVKAYAHRGTIYDRLGRFDEAIDAYRKAVEVDPTYAFALKTLGSLYGKKGDYPRSILYLRKAGQLSPNDPDIHYQLGIGYLRQGQFEESAEQGTILMRLKRPDLSEKLKRGAAQDSQRNLAR